MIKNIKSKLKRYFNKVIKLKTSPHSVAAGFSIGTLIALLPTFGLGLLIGLAVLFIFKKISKISLLLSFIFWNPLVLAFTYPLSFSIGNKILSNSSVKVYSTEFLNSFFAYTRRFLVGNFILAVTLALASYLVILLIINFYKKYEKQLRID